MCNRLFYSFVINIFLDTIFTLFYIFLSVRYGGEILPQSCKAAKKNRKDFRRQIKFANAGMFTK